MPILCIDPGFRALGLVVYNPALDAIADYGVLLTDPRDYKKVKKAEGSSKADARFLQEVGRFLSEYARRHRIKRVVLELPHGRGRSYRATSMLAAVGGAVIGWASAKRIPLTYYSPERNKKCAAGDIHADKATVEVAVRKRWPSPFWSELKDKEREHVCDAAALALTALAHGVVSAGPSR